MKSKKTDLYFNDKLKSFVNKAIGFLLLSFGFIFIYSFFKFPFMKDFKDFLGISFYFISGLFFSYSIIFFKNNLKYHFYVVLFSSLLSIVLLSFNFAILSSVFNNYLFMGGVFGFSLYNFVFGFFDKFPGLLIYIHMLFLFFLMPLCFMFVLVSYNMNLENFVGFLKLIKRILFFVFKLFYKLFFLLFSGKIFAKKSAKVIIKDVKKVSVNIKKSVKNPVESVKNEIKDDRVHFQLPPISLLQNAPHTSSFISREEMIRNARNLERHLAEYKVFGKVINFVPGPVVTLYEFEPEAGIKNSQVLNLETDISRLMSSMSSVRIAVVKGKNAIGIELPNLKRQTVYIRHQLSSADFVNSNFDLPLSLGQDTAGNSVSVDLAKMPHLLVAGTTGSGKSVGINAFVLSLLYKFTPYECRFIMIDPKQLELSVYNGIPHLLTPVLTKPDVAVGALKWVVREMEERYSKLTDYGAKNIVSFNEKVKLMKKSGRKIYKNVMDSNGQMIKKALDYDELPYIVIIIDELSDLMVQARKDVEAVILRLAQMGRASGIHLILATQRPSVDVITGLIKSNIPSRISFKLPTQMDSKTILDTKGAEQLLGNGDMLYMAQGKNLIRVHGSFVSEEDVDAVAKFWRKQSTPEFDSNVIKEEEFVNPKDGKQSFLDKTVFAGNSKGGLSDDELYQKAIALVMETGRTSSSFVQRNFSIGYNKAANIVERMEKDGILSAPDNTGKRKIIKRV